MPIEVQHIILEELPSYWNIGVLCCFEVSSKQCNYCPHLHDYIFGSKKRDLLVACPPVISASFLSLWCFMNFSLVSIAIVNFLPSLRPIVFAIIFKPLQLYPNVVFQYPSLSFIVLSSYCCVVMHKRWGGA